MKDKCDNLQAMIEDLPEKIIIVRGGYKLNEVYRLLITRTGQKTAPFVVRYAKQRSDRKDGREYEYFSARLYCFNHTGKTLVEAVQLMHAQIEDLKLRGYLEEWGQKSCSFKLKRYKEDNDHDPTGSSLIDWDKGDFIPPYDYDFEPESQCICD